MSRSSEPIKNPGELTWIGERQRNAPRIPQGTWDQHRQQIEELYATETLEQVMGIMALEHNFTPRSVCFQREREFGRVDLRVGSKSQYTTQLRNWDVRKYNVEAAEASDAANTTYGRDAAATLLETSIQDVSTGNSSSGGLKPRTKRARELSITSSTSSFSRRPMKKVFQKDETSVEPEPEHLDGVIIPEGDVDQAPVTADLEVNASFVRSFSTSWMTIEELKATATQITWAHLSKCDNSEYDISKMFCAAEELAGLGEKDLAVNIYVALVHCCSNSLLEYLQTRLALQGSLDDSPHIVATSHRVPEYLMIGPSVRAVAWLCPNRFCEVKHVMRLICEEVHTQMLKRSFLPMLHEIWSGLWLFTVSNPDCPIPSARAIWDTWPFSFHSDFEVHSRAPFHFATHEEYSNILLHGLHMYHCIKRAGFRQRRWLLRDPPFSELLHVPKLHACLIASGILTCLDRINEIIQGHSFAATLADSSGQFSYSLFGQLWRHRRSIYQRTPVPLSVLNFDDPVSGSYTTADQIFLNEALKLRWCCAVIESTSIQNMDRYTLGSIALLRDKCHWLTCQSRDHRCDIFLEQDPSSYSSISGWLRELGSTNSDESPVKDRIYLPRATLASSLSSPDFSVMQHIKCRARSLLGQAAGTCPSIKSMHTLKSHSTISSKAISDLSDHFGSLGLIAPSGPTEFDGARIDGARIDGIVNIQTVRPKPDAAAETLHRLLGPQKTKNKPPTALFTLSEETGTSFADFPTHDTDDSFSLESSSGDSDSVLDMREGHGE